MEDNKKVVTGNCVVVDAPKRDGEVVTGEKVYFTNIIEKKENNGKIDGV